MTTHHPKAPALSTARLHELIEQAIVDAYGVEEQRAGFHEKLNEHLSLPFKTEVLGVEVDVVRLDETDATELIAICRRGPHTQPIPLLDLPMPTPPPEGAEWIEAYRSWARSD